MLKLWLTLLAGLISLDVHASAPCNLELGELPRNVRQAISRDLTVIAGLRGETASPLHQYFFGSYFVDGNAYCDFFRSQVDRFAFEPGGNPGEVANYDPTTRTVHLHNEFFRDSLVGRLSTLIHEVAHARRVPHVACPIPFLDQAGNRVRGELSGVDLSGRYACDDEIDGAYSIESVWLANIATNCANCGPQFKAEAQKAVELSLIRVIGEPLVEALKADITKSAPPPQISLGGARSFAF